MITNQLVEIIKSKSDEGYNAFGIRSISDRFGRFEVGDNVPDSYNWDFDRDCSTYHTTGETLNGASAVGISIDYLWLDGDDDDELAERIEKALEKSAVYENDEVMLIGGKSGFDFGDDVGEYVIPDAKVLAVIK